MDKRRFVSFLPTYNQTSDLISFFGGTVDETFQPGFAQSLTGYVGRQPVKHSASVITVDDRPKDSVKLKFADTSGIEKGQTVAGTNIATDTVVIAKNSDQVLLSSPTTGFIPHGSPIMFYDPEFYIEEITDSRSAYQLESGMTSRDAADNINNALTYPDLVSYLAAEGAIVTDHQRLFETDYYTWAPPINVDMLLNYRQYVWFGDATGAIELPTLQIFVPMNRYVGDGVTILFPLPMSINAVSPDNETVTVYIDGRQTGAFNIAQDSVLLDDPPAVGAQILMARVFDFEGSISGQTTVNIADINYHGVTYLSSGMRIEIFDMLHIVGSWDGSSWDFALMVPSPHPGRWDQGGVRVYMVDGVGQSIRFTEDASMIRDTEPQYITIDRSSRQTNLWSAHNSWVHRDTFAWSGLEFPERRAKRPIIEFIRDLVIYPGQVWHESAGESTDPLFMLYDLHGHALNDPGFYPNSDFKGNRLIGFKAPASDTAPVDKVLHRSLSFDNIGYIMFEVDMATLEYTYSLTPETPRLLIECLRCYGIDDSIASPGSSMNPLSPPMIQSIWRLNEGTTKQSIMPNGFYEVPLNLQANPNSLEVTGDRDSPLSQATYLEHFTSIIGNQQSILGQPFGDNTYRDSPRDLSLGLIILQHRAPLLKTMLLANNATYDLPQAIRFAEQEYTKFRNKFVRKLSDLDDRGTLRGIDPTVYPMQWVTAALDEFKHDKSINMPFALNRIGGDQYFIPPTPAALGMLPAAIPCMVSDITHVSPDMLQGHDGSLTVAFQDWRDDVVLQLETIIYHNLPEKFRTEARPVFDIANWIGGRFYAPYNGYSFDEFRAILTPSFELWAYSNRMDYRINTTFDSNDPFTWNYDGVLDRFGNMLPAYWRTIYQWYYGTDAPHVRPWEMLGFVSEPAWWSVRYGGPPYAKANATLWHDLEVGFIADGPRQGIDVIYARPGLADLIPVDAAGRLLDPIEIGIVTATVSVNVMSAAWPTAGGPVYAQWVDSPSYRYAVALASFLMKPPRLVEECWDTQNIGFIGEQWVNLETPVRPFQRPQNSSQYAFGETMPDGSISTITGISQWIADFLAFSGQTPAEFGSAIRNLDVHLMHQMAGFVSLDNIKVVADDFGLVPTEDINIVLYNSPVLSSETYSGVILQWTGHSWQAIGYDGRNAFFTIIPPDPLGPKGVISLGQNEPNILPWHSNTYYSTGIFVVYLGSVYEALRSHTSGPNFELIYWKAKPDLTANLTRAPRVLTYLQGLRTTQRVPYGTEFTSYQDVADFLLGWERWLVSRGWVFDTIEPFSGLLRSWNMAVREFLIWAQVQWAPGNFIALSPGMQDLKFSTQFGQILNAESNFTGFFGLLDRSASPISNRDAIVNRLDGTIKLGAKNADIFAARLDLATIEHTLVFDNITIFDDIIYLPLFNQRQDRLRLICNRTPNWSGRLDAPGFIIMNDRLVSNFEKAANDVRFTFDIELSDRGDLRTYARHLLGYQHRDYFENLLLSETEQIEFYSGMIQQKGAPGVFNKLMRSSRASNHTSLFFLEEWAVRVGKIGAPDDPVVRFQLHQTETRSDRQIVRFVPTPTAPVDWIILSSDDPRWVAPPQNPAFFPMFAQGAKLPTAGPVRLTEVQNTAFHMADVPSVYKKNGGYATFPTGSLTWVYDRGDGSFTVLHSFDIGIGDAPNRISVIVSPNDDPETTDSEFVTTTRLHFQLQSTLTTADVGNYLVVEGSSGTNREIEGVQVISAVSPNQDYVDLVMVSTNGHDFAPDELATAPIVRVLREARYPDRSKLPGQPHVGDLVWVDQDSNGLWSVLQWSGTLWTTVRVQPQRVDPSTISETLIYDDLTRIVDQKMITNPPVVDELVVIDSVMGLIAGVADREIDFKTEYDPARYNAGATGFAANPWGSQEVGRVWWDLSTVKLLDPYTDILGITADRDVAELRYRVDKWASVAPKSSVDVYEWIESTLPPRSYSAPSTVPPIGTVYNVDNPSWVEKTEYRSNVPHTLYYYWVKGRVTIPDVPFRHLDVTSIAIAIENPSALGLSWMAAVHADTLFVSGVEPFLNDQSTVMKVRLTIDPDNVGRHDQWVILREKDANSITPPFLWDCLRDSLSGFDIYMNAIPNPWLPSRQRAGIDRGQSLFTNDRAGMLAARETFVNKVNQIFALTPVILDRAVLVSSLQLTTPIDEFLKWSQIYPTDTNQPAPDNEWDIEVYTLGERNRLLARQSVQDTINNGQKVRVLLNGIGEPTQRWSIWEIDPSRLSSPILINQKPDVVFQLARSYEVAVNTIAERDLLITPPNELTIGSRVLVRHDSFDFWAIYKWLGTGFELWRIQTYRTDDFMMPVDWYASGYRAEKPPIVSYATELIRDQVEGDTPTNLFVRIDNSGDWFWTAWDLDVKLWTTVAIRNGTIALSELFYDPTRTKLALDTTPSWDAIKNRDGAWELRVIVDMLRYGGVLDETNTDFLQDSELNEIFFTMLNFILVQQDSVDWVFKTSFMSMLGYNVPLVQTAVQEQDNTPDLLSYIEEIKPYHVKMRDFYAQYNAGMDIASVIVTDFDKPIYWDPVKRVYRVLDPNDPDDVAILSTTRPWSFWYPVRDQALVRSFDITLLFDRVTGSPSAWDSDPWDAVPWDPTDLKYSILTTITESLVEDGPTISVACIDDLMTADLPFPVFINGHRYLVGTVTPDDLDVSSVRHVRSGSLTTYSGNFLITDGNAGTSVEAVIDASAAARRILDYYHPSSKMPPRDLTLLLNLDMRGLTATQRITAPVLVGDTVIRVESTENISLNQMVIEPAFIKGTIITQTTEDTITLSKGAIEDLPAGADLVFTLPVWIDGSTPMSGSATSFDMSGFDVSGFDIATGLLYGLYDGGVNPIDPANLLYSINPPLPSRPGGYDFRAPYVAANHPEERVPLTSDDGLHFSVRRSPGAGAPGQNIMTFDVSTLFDDSIELFFDLIAQSAQAVYVYRDGIRAELDNDYTVDHLKRTATVNLLIGVDRVQCVTIHAFGFGGTSAIIDQYFLAYSTSPILLEQSTTKNNTLLVVNGSDVPVAQYTVTNNPVLAGCEGHGEIGILFHSMPAETHAHPSGETGESAYAGVDLFSPPEVGSDVAIILYEGGIDTAITIQPQQLPYEADTIPTWPLDPIETFPQHAAAIVEVNGKRLTPPQTFYGAFTVANPWMVIPIALSDQHGPLGKVTIYVDNVERPPTDLCYCTTSQPNSPYPFKLNIPVTSPMPKFAVVGQMLVALVAGFTSDNVVVVVEIEPPDYTVENNELTIYVPLMPTDSIEVTTFSHDASMGWQVAAYLAPLQQPYIVPKPFGKDYALVTLNGLALAPDNDYKLLDGDFSFDTGGLSTIPSGLTYAATEIVLMKPPPKDARQWLVASTCNASPAQQEVQWSVSTATPARIRMPPIMQSDTSRMMAVPTNGDIITPQPVCDIRYDYLEQSPYLSGTLQSELDWNANQMVVDVPLREITSKLEAQYPFPSVITEDDPGVVWIAGERIEYFTHERTDSAVTLGRLRRGTKGTSVPDSYAPGTIVHHGKLVITVPPF